MKTEAEIRVEGGSAVFRVCTQPEPEPEQPAKRRRICPDAGGTMKVEMPCPTVNFCHNFNSLQRACAHACRGRKLRGGVGGRCCSTGQRSAQCVRPAVQHVPGSAARCLAAALLPHEQPQDGSPVQQACPVEQKKTLSWVNGLHPCKNNPLHVVVSMASVSPLAFAASRVLGAMRHAWQAAVPARWLKHAVFTY